MQTDMMNRDGKSETVLERIKIYGTFDGPFRRTNPHTGKRGRKYMQAFARPCGTDNEPMEIILQSNYARGHAGFVVVDAEIRRHSDGKQFLCAYLAIHNTAPVNQEWEVVAR